MRKNLLFVICLILIDVVLLMVYLELNGRKVGYNFPECFEPIIYNNTVLWVDDVAIDSSGYDDNPAMTICDKWGHCLLYPVKRTEHD